MTGWRFIVKTETTRERLYDRALERGLRRSTVQSYRKLLEQLGVLDMPVDEVSREVVLEKLFSIQNPNSRRAAVIAVRSVLGLSIKIPRGVPRRYDLPDENTLRLALMTCRKHEVRGLLMMYAGLRIGEACAITGRDVDGDVLRVDKQVTVLFQTGKPTQVEVGPVKGNVDTVVIPLWLTPMVEHLDQTVRPDSVRESLRRAGWKVGINLNPHLLRHWYATTLLARGVPLALVSRQMRHSDVAITLRTYSQFNARGSIHDALG